MRRFRLPDMGDNKPQILRSGPRFTGHFVDAFKKQLTSAGGCKDKQRGCHPGSPAGASCSKAIGRPASGQAGDVYDGDPERRGDRPEGRVDS